MKDCIRTPRQYATFTCAPKLRDTTPHTPHNVLQLTNRSFTYQKHIDEQKSPVTALGYIQTGRTIRSHAVTEAQEKTHGHRNHDVQRGKWDRVSQEEKGTDRVTRHMDKHTVTQTETVKWQT